jgi:hypothetical protein
MAESPNNDDSGLKPSGISFTTTPSMGFSDFESKATPSTREVDCAEFDVCVANKTMANTRIFFTATPLSTA